MREEAYPDLIASNREVDRAIERHMPMPIEETDRSPTERFDNLAKYFESLEGYQKRGATSSEREDKTLAIALPVGEDEEIILNLNLLYVEQGGFGNTDGLDEIKVVT